MSDPLYVPVLPMRQHAVDAYTKLQRDIRLALTPLWNLPSYSDEDMHKAVGGLRTSSGDDVLTAVLAAHLVRPGWLDAPFATEGQVPAVSEGLSEFMASVPLLRPVTGPDRSTVQQSSALETARLDGRGVGIRVPVHHAWGGRTAEDTTGLLNSVGSDVPVDLLLDMGAVLPSRPDAGKEALRALDALFPVLARLTCRTIAVLGGGFPVIPSDELQLGRPHAVLRTDWHMWQELRTSDRDYVPWLAYGDYCVLPASALGQQRRKGRGGPRWWSLRYTTDDWFVLNKVPHRSPGSGTRTELIRAAAAQICDLRDFRPDFSEGEKWLHECAAGDVTSGKGTGGFSQWLWTGNVQHMTYAVRSLDGNR